MNNNSLEIQREAIIEISGTKDNHLAVLPHQKLIMRHQSDTSVDENTVVICTDSGKEFGIMPKEYAAHYAQALDSGRYDFTIEVINAKYTAESPIFTVRIISEPCARSEKEIETNILEFVQNVVNVYEQRKSEYLDFIYSEHVDLENLVSTLNEVRFIQKLYSLSYAVIANHKIEKNDHAIIKYTKWQLANVIDEFEDEIASILKKIQKSYNESFDIDDEEEYRKAQSEIRERRKMFRSYNELFASYRDAIENFSYVKGISDNVLNQTIESISNDSKSLDTLEKISSVPQNSSIAEKFIDLTEDAFLSWLLSNGEIAETTAKQYISNIHSIERLYQVIFGNREHILGAGSADEAKNVIEKLIVRNEYIDANGRRNNSFNAALNKFVQFADISVDRLKTQTSKKNYQQPADNGTPIVKTVDFEHPQSCTYCKPVSFVLHGTRFSAESWYELYEKFLKLLYKDDTYLKILRGLICKSLYGRRYDFTDTQHKQPLRKAIKISSDFYAEGNLSTIDIIKHIKYLMNLCHIDNDHMTIEYIAQDGNTEVETVEKHIENIPPQLSAPIKSDKISDEPVSDKALPKTNAQPDAQTCVRFAPDRTKPFELKTAVTEILSSDDPAIKKYKIYRNGISLKDLRELIHKYYGKQIGPFELSKLLMLDKAFQPVGKGCYVLNPSTIQRRNIPEVQKHDMPVKTEKSTDTVIAPHVLPNTITESIEEKATTENNDVTIEAILKVIKDNCDELQYKDGFGVYEIKTLLAGRGIFASSEEKIKALMSGCSELTEIEDGYFVFAKKEKPSEPMSNSFSVFSKQDSVPHKEEITDFTNSGQIVFRLNGRDISAYDYSDALNKVCEFAINYKPFQMARIAGQGMQLDGKNIFYRSPAPIAGYNNLSNGLQVMPISTVSELRRITDEVIKYCQIDNKMITFSDK